MKVLFINDNYFLTGGSNISNRNLVKFLCSKDIAVSVITGSNDKIALKSLHVYTLPLLIRKHPAQFAFPNMMKIKQIIAKENPDLIHLQVPSPISLIALWLAKRKRIPIVIGIHELPINIAVYSPIARGLIEIFSRKILAYGLGKANVAIAPTEFEVSS
jgi:glycosyltransferase involved in cell wall biosynthesis